MSKIDAAADRFEARLVLSDVKNIPRVLSIRAAEISMLQDRQTVLDSVADLASRLGFHALTLEIFDTMKIQILRLILFKLPTMIVGP
jgi:hypothetical protein